MRTIDGSNADEGNRRKSSIMWSSIPQINSATTKSCVTPDKTLFLLSRLTVLLFLAEIFCTVIHLYTTNSDCKNFQAKQKLEINYRCIDNSVADNWEDLEHKIYNNNGKKVPSLKVRPMICYEAGTLQLKNFSHRKADLRSDFSFF